MKKVMSTCPVLALPYFVQPSVVECNASREDVRVVLMQNQHPIDYESRKLSGIEKLYSIYDKEMFLIMHALARFK